VPLELAHLLAGRYVPHAGSMWEGFRVRVFRQLHSSFQTASKQLPGSFGALVEWE
jgi:hypothetical protein